VPTGCSTLIGTTVEETIEMDACVIAIGVIARVIAERLQLFGSPNPDSAVRADEKSSATARRAARGARVPNQRRGRRFSRRAVQPR
jgi:hypothetical protein